MDSRSVDELDAPRLRLVLAMAQADAVGLGLSMESFSVDWAVKQVLAGKVRGLWISDHTLLLYGITYSCWHSPSLCVLHELLLYKYNHAKRNTFRETLAALDDLALTEGAQFISVGNTLTNKPEAVRRMYLRSGYKDVAATLIKETA